MITESYFIVFWKSLNAALAFVNLVEATAGQATRCYALGLSVAEAVTILAMSQAKRQEAA